MGDPERHGRTHLERTPRFRMQLLNQQVRLLDFGKDPFAPFVIRLPHFGHADTAGCAIQ